MDKETIEKNLKDALELYNNGKYSEAERLWKEVLAADPSNKQALEGVKMAELLSQQWIDEGSETAGVFKEMKTLEEEKEAIEAPSEPERRDAEEKAAGEETGEEEATGKKAAEDETKGDETAGVERPDTGMRFDSEAKSKALIAEGEKLLDSGHYGEAIDRFSRAMVLDEGNHRAQSLLSRSRGLLEKEQQELEKKLHSAIELFDKGDYDASEKIFQEIISVNPQHNDALFYLEKLQKAKEELNSIPSIAVGKADEKEQKPKGPAGAGTLAEEETIKVARPRRRPTASEMAAQSTAKPRKSVITRITLIVVPLLFIVAGFFLVRYVIDKFPFTRSRSDATAEQTDTAEQQKPREDAAASKPQQASAGTVDRTTEAPSRVPNQNLSPAQMSEHAQKLVNEGRSLLQEGRAIDAEKKFREASILDPLNMDAKRFLEETSVVANAERNYMEKKERGVQCFQEGDYTEALRIFYRLPEENKEPIIGRYILNSWYNLGIASLQTGNITEAKNAFNEVLAINPSDSSAKKEKEMAEWYLEHRLDDAYMNHVDSLKYRRLDH